MTEEELIEKLAEIAIKMGWQMALHADGNDVLGITIGCGELLDSFDGDVDVWGKRETTDLDS